MLVIATPDPDSTAETFVRQHIRLISPGRTAVLFAKGDGRCVQGLPSHKVSFDGAGSKLGALRNLMISGYSGSIEGTDKEALADFLKNVGAKSVLAEFGQTACAICRACQLAGVPLYPFFHGQDAGSAINDSIRRYAYWRMGRYATKVFVGTKFFGETVRRVGIPRAKIVVAPHGVEKEQFRPSETKDETLVLAVGRMVEKKAPHLTVEAFEKVLIEVPKARLEMVGDGPFLQKARNKAIELGISEQVVFHGAQNHEFVKDLMSRAAVFVQHSVTAANGDTESLGVTLLEAMACEVPVVTTRHNGFVETVEDGVTGFLVEERDVDAMADRLVSVLTDTDLRKTLGRAGRKRVTDSYEASAQARRLGRLLEVE